MKAEHKRKWLEALRSGQYEQGRGWLKVNRKGIFHYCCLGVVCDLLKEDVDILETWNISNVNVRRFSGSATYMHYDTAKAIGLPYHLTTELIRLNDSEEKTFDQIADWIEENVPTDSKTETATPEASAVRHPNP